MKPLASGRASEIFDLGDGRVLRRFKAGGDPQGEARVMRHVRANGFPVPEVLELREDSLVLERIDGPTMLHDFFRHPWRLRAYASTLADLHRRLHDIETDGGRQLHMDLHPDNVILSARGPVVIDWAMARSGDPALDVAMTWVILHGSGGPAGRVFLRPFLAHFDEGAVRRALPEAVALRVRDPNVTAGERRAVQRLIRPG